MAALEDGTLSTYAADVFEREPPSPDSALLRCETFFGTPHIGAATLEAQDRVGMRIVSSVLDALEYGEDGSKQEGMGDSQKPDGIVLDPWNARSTGDIAPAAYGIAQEARGSLGRVNPSPRMCCDAGASDEGPPSATSHVRRTAASLLAAALGSVPSTSWALSLETPTPWTKELPAQEKGGSLGLFSRGTFRRLENPY